MSLSRSKGGELQCHRRVSDETTSTHTSPQNLHVGKSRTMPTLVELHPCRLFRLGTILAGGVPKSNSTQTLRGVPKSNMLNAYSVVCRRATRERLSSVPKSNGVQKLRGVPKSNTLDSLARFLQGVLGCIGAGIGQRRAVQRMVT